MAWAAFAHNLHALRPIHNRTPSAGTVSTKKVALFPRADCTDQRVTTEERVQIARDHAAEKATYTSNDLNRLLIQQRRRIKITLTHV